MPKDTLKGWLPDVLITKYKALTPTTSSSSRRSSSGGRCSSASWATAPLRMGEEQAGYAFEKALRQELEDGDGERGAGFLIKNGGNIYIMKA